MAQSSPQHGILWISNSAAAHTGYGNQTKLFTPRLATAGYQVAIGAFYGREGFCSLNPDGILELPRLRDSYMNDIVEAHLQFCRSHWPQVAEWRVLTLIDPFVLDAEVYASLPWVAWCPVDSAPEKATNQAILAKSRWQLAMSRFGEAQLQAIGLQPFYVPHAIDTDLFMPRDRRIAREQLSREWGIDVRDSFLIVENAANKGYPSRKNFDGLFRSVATFCAENPDIDTRLYVHSETEGIWQGERLREMAMAYGLGERVIFAHQYRYLMGLYDEAYLTRVYSAADTMLHLAFGEGFGIPIVEAQACGCPVIATDFSSMSELIFSGYKVPAIPFGFHSPSQWGFPLISEAVRGLVWAWEQRQNPAIREAARQGALAYDADHVFETYMLPTLDKIFADTSAPIR